MAAPKFSVTQHHKWTTLFEAARNPSLIAALCPQLTPYLAIVWTLAIGVILGWLFRDHGFDDPYITYRYASNLAHGNGFVYNLGERVLSTTTPLYTLLLAMVGLMGIDIPPASTAIGCFSLALGGFAFWQLGKACQTPLAGLVGLFLYPTCSLLIPTLGAETPLYVTLAVCGFACYVHERFCLAAIMLAFATLTRADGVLIATVLGIHFMLHRQDPLPWRAIGIYAGLGLSWLLFAWFYFGTPLPTTLMVKQQQGLMAISRSFFEGLLSLAGGYWRNSYYTPQLVLAVIGLTRALRHRSPWLLILSWNVLYVAAYSLLGVSSYFWYYGPLAAGFIALVALGVEGSLQASRTLLGHSSFLICAVVLLGMLGTAQVRSIDTLSQNSDRRLPIYRAVGEWIQAYTAPSASVGTLEVGIIGYYAERTMIDFAGLLQPQTALQLTTNSTYEAAALWASEHYRPDYLVLHAGHFPRLEQHRQVRAACHVARTFRDTNYSHRLVVYRCRW